MPLITFIDESGNERLVVAKIGRTLMEAAIYNGIDEVEARCGGALSCASCHVYIAEQWYERIPGPDDSEDDMLAFVKERQVTSRLSCQIRVSEDLEGMVVHLPKDQVQD